MFRALLPLLIAALPATLAEVLETTPADSLAAPLRRLEQRMGRSQAAGAVAFELGRFHFARGEYRQAALSLGRAAARLEPDRKTEARYFQGLALLALQQPAEARVTLEEVARAAPTRRADAALAISHAWEQDGRPDRALEVLERLLREGAGETAPAALERAAQFALQLGRADQARRAAERLAREYPGSVEAARLRGGAAATPGARVALRLGVFSEEARAQSLAAEARRAGFTATQVVSRRDGGRRLWVVRAGSWPSREDAARAAERIERVLGVQPVAEDAR